MSINVETNFNIRYYVYLLFVSCFQSFYSVFAIIDTKTRHAVVVSSVLATSSGQHVNVTGYSLRSEVGYFIWDIPTSNLVLHALLLGDIRVRCSTIGKCVTANLVHMM